MKPEPILYRMVSVIIGLLIVAIILALGLVTIQWGGFALLLVPTMLILLILSSYVLVLAVRYSKVRVAEQASIQKDRLRLLTLVNSLGEAVFAVDGNGRISVYNAASLELIDSHEDIFGKPIDKVMKLVNAKHEPQSSIQEVFQNGRVIMRDDLILRTKSADVNVYLTITPIKERGELTGAIVLARDISKQKNLDTQKDEFLSVISHELRTPVAVVEADLSTVLLPGYAKISSKALKLIRSASQNLTYLSGLLQDISDLSHSEKSVLDTEIVSFSAQKLVQELADDLENQAKKSKLAIKLQIDHSNIELANSYQRVKEILVNFITNALKYSAGQGHTVTIAVHPSKRFINGASFTVTDEGIGISAVDMKKLFKKFFRSTRREVQQIRGTGMGLYITTKQAQKIGAHISVTSKLGHGSSFSLDVPANFHQTAKPKVKK